MLLINIYEYHLTGNGKKSMSIGYDAASLRHTHENLLMLLPRSRWREVPRSGTRAA